MCHNVSRLAHRLVVVTVIFIFTVISEAVPISGENEEPSIIRQNFSPTPVTPSPDPVVDPSICKPSTLNPAVDCACYAYKAQYHLVPKYQFLDGLCLAELNGDIDAGYEQCPFTDFMESGQVMIDNVDDFFLDARTTCAYEGALPSAHFLSTSKRNADMDTFRLGTSMSEYGRNLMGPSAVRIPRRDTHKKIANLCLVISHRRNIPRARAYDECCPNI